MLYIEIKVHHEVDLEKQKALQAANLDVIEIDLQALVDQQGITKERIIEAVVSSAPRSWVCQHRFNAEIDDLHQQLKMEIAQSDQRAAIERKSARDQRSREKKIWRSSHQTELELIESYADPKNRREALEKFKRWCMKPGRPEHKVYDNLVNQYGHIPNIVNIPVKGELAFKAHRIYWQTLIFCNVIQTMFENTKRKIAQEKQRNRRHFYGDEAAWLCELPGVTPGRVYQILMENQLSLTTVSQMFQDLSGKPIPENYSSRPDSLQFVMVKEYEIIPKPVPAIRRYLNALAQSGILDPSGDVYFMQYQDRPDFLHPVKNYSVLKDEGLKQYEC